MEYKTYKELKENYPNIQWEPSYNKAEVNGIDIITRKKYILKGKDLVNKIYKPIPVE